MAGGRAPYQKGFRLENFCRLFFKEGGLQCRRVPMSGSGEEKGDLILHTGWGQRLVGECKSRGEGPKWLTNALGDHDFLILKYDRGQPMVMLRLDHFRDLCQ